MGALPVHDVNHEPTLDNASLVPCGSFQHSADIDFRHATLLHAQFRVSRER
jgi:hypothetical protein